MRFYPSLTTQKFRSWRSLLANISGCNYAVATNSGNSGLHLAMCALDFKRGDKGYM